ncbi:hypothetical protein FIU96_18725 [Marinobacter sp. THAF39]|nr:hypothetical protein FIV08_18820 [Marinobacter sp. THAF197a]QFT52684.1 hypothetical protein FIU96_18725 [Marinobacter sp. THAF39]
MAEPKRHMDVPKERVLESPPQPGASSEARPVRIHAQNPKPKAPTPKCRTNPKAQAWPASSTT